MVTKLGRILFQTSELKIVSGTSIPKFSFYQKKNGEYSDPVMDRLDCYITINIRPKDRNLPYQSCSAFLLEPEYYTLVKAWMEVLHWFYDPDKKDLFLFDENGNLMFNTTYNDLGKTVTDSKKYPNTQKITVMPNLVYRGDKTHEGIVLHLRDLDVQTTLTRNEFANLVKILQGFSYADEPFRLAFAYWFAEKHKTLQEMTGFQFQTDDKIQNIIQGTVIENRHKSDGGFHFN